jgi:hypothetical protein
MCYARGSNTSSKKRKEKSYGLGGTAVPAVNREFYYTSQRALSLCSVRAAIAGPEIPLWKPAYAACRLGFPS